MENYKCKCSSEMFKVYENGNCDKCLQNGVWSDEEDCYIYPTDIENKIIRTQCSHEGYCKLGDNYNNGCWIYECSTCGQKTMIPRVDC